MPEHIVSGAPFPNGHPRGYVVDQTVQEPVFNPAVHLELTAPEWIKPLISEHSRTHGDHPVKFPLPINPAPSGTAQSLGPQGGEVPFPGLAFTAPFKVLSDEGVRVMRQCIANNEKFAVSNERQPKSLRGIGYRSKFIRDFTYHPAVLEHLSKMGGVPLHPHDMGMNIAQINFGEIGSKRPVDRWHLDSVPYVMVVLLSDARDMVGGKLQVARIEDPKDALRQVLAEEMDPSSIELVNYPGPGYAIFMQGSAIAHSVTSVQEAREPRLTLVNSYQTLNPFAEVKTSYCTFKRLDPLDAAPAEIGRHYAWRAAGQLDYLIREGLFEEDPEKLLAVLDGAANEVRKARDYIRGDDIDEAPYRIDTASEGYRAMLERRKAEEVALADAAADDDDANANATQQARRPASRATTANASANANAAANATDDETQTRKQSGRQHAQPKAAEAEAAAEEEEKEQQQGEKEQRTTRSKL